MFYIFAMSSVHNLFQLFFCGELVCPGGADFSALHMQNYQMCFLNDFVVCGS